MAVYLLHSDVPLLRSDGTPVAHYVGYAPDGEVGRRFHDHLKGRHPARLVQAFLEAGGVLILGNVWKGQGRDYERRLKKMGHLSRRCYQCKMKQLVDEWNNAVGEELPPSRSGDGRLTRLAVSGPLSSTATT